MNIISSDSIQKTACEIMMNYINTCNIEAVHALLIEGEVNLEFKDSVGMTPLHLAVQNNNILITNLLLDFGANPNSRREYSIGHETPLLIAAEFNYYKICEMLLDYGADPTAKNSTGMNPLHLSAKNGNLEISLLLISRGCDPNIRDDFGNNASYWAKRNHFLDLLQYLPPPLSVNPVENKEFKEEARAYKMNIDLEEERKKAAKKGKKKK